jgi:flagellar biosynthetic protein FliR
LVLGYFLFHYVGAFDYSITTGMTTIVALAVREVLFGLILGLLFQIIFLGVQFAGGLIDYQIGFALVNVVDPYTSTNIPILAQTKMLLATLIFLMINGHHVLLQGLFESFRLVPLGKVSFQAPLLADIVHFSGRAFAIGLKLAAPVVVTLFITDVCMGIVARTMPQMNVFIVGFPLKIGVGLFVVALSLPVFNYVFTKLLNLMNLDALQLSKGFAG